jgi:ABC-2 type transport system permease protein
MQQAQHEFAGTAQMYIKELWNLPIATIPLFLIYFIEVTFCSSFYAAIGAAVNRLTKKRTMTPTSSAVCMSG